MKKFELKNKEIITINTDPNELTFLESELFKQYFLKILYDIDTLIFDEFKEKIFESLNKQRVAEAVVLFENFSQGLKLQNIERNAWAVCFAILVKKDKPCLSESELFNIFSEIDEKGIDKELLQNEVVNFSKPFPKLHNIWQVKSEGLTTADLMRLIS